MLGLAALGGKCVSAAGGAAQCASAECWDWPLWGGSALVCAWGKGLLRRGCPMREWEPDLSCPAQPCPAVSGPVLPCPALSCPALPCPARPPRPARPARSARPAHPALPCPALPCVVCPGHLCPESCPALCGVPGSAMCMRPTIQVRASWPSGGATAPLSVTMYRRMGVLVSHDAPPYTSRPHTSHLLIRRHHTHTLPPPPPPPPRPVHPTLTLPPPLPVRPVQAAVQPA